MPEDSTIRIRQILDLSDFKAKSAESKAMVAQQLGELKAQYAQATAAAKSAINDLRAAESQLGKFAAAGSEEAKAALEGYRQKVAETTAEQVRLGGQLGVAQEEMRALNAATVNAAGSMRGFGAATAGARVEVGAMTGNVSGLEMGLARLAIQSKAIGPLMQEALPLAIALALNEALGALAVHIRNVGEELIGLKQFRDAENEIFETSHRLFLEQVKVREQNAKIAAEGLEGTAKLNVEMRGASPILADITNRQKQAAVELQSWQDRLTNLTIAYDQAGGVLNGFNQLRKRDMDEAKEKIAEEKRFVEALGSAYRSLAEQQQSAHKEVGVEAEKRSLEDRKAALEAQHRFEQDNYILTIAHIKDVAERRRVAGETETKIANDTVRLTVDANAQKLKSDQQLNEGLRQLAEERGRKTGANVQPEITGLNASEIHADAEKIKADLGAVDAWYKTLETDAKKTAEAVEKVLGQANRAQMEDIRRTGEEAHRAFEQQILDARATAQEEIAASREKRDEQLLLFSQTRTMTVQKAREEVAVVLQSVARQMEALRQLEQFELQMGTRTVQEEKRIAKERDEIERQSMRQIAQIQREELHNYEQMFSRIADITTRDLTEILKRQKTFGQAMADVYDHMVESIIANLGRWLAQELAAELTHQAIAKKGIVTDAGSAGASAFRWVMKEVPFPVNAVLAPVAAAAAFTGVMAFGGSFEHGGIVPGQQGRAVPVVAHGGEMYLGTKLSQTVQRLSGGAALSGHNSRINVNFSPTINHPMTESDLRPHARTIAQMVQSEMKKFNR